MGKLRYAGRVSKGVYKYANESVRPKKTASKKASTKKKSAKRRSL